LSYRYSSVESRSTLGLQRDNTSAARHAIKIGAQLRGELHVLTRSFEHYNETAFSFIAQPNTSRLACARSGPHPEGCWERKTLL
jgi:hypothetical protein